MCVCVCVCVCTLNILPVLYTVQPLYTFTISITINNFNILTIYEAYSESKYRFAVKKIE